MQLMELTVLDPCYPFAVYPTARLASHYAKSFYSLNTVYVLSLLKC